MTAPKTIAFASSKGGVGKSTCCACLAAAYAAEGHKVCILDLDQNRTLARWSEQFPQANVEVQAVARDDLEAAFAEAEQGDPCDMLLIDVAGLYEESLILAINSADMVVIPSQASAPDLLEAARIVEDIRAYENRFGAVVPHALLLTAVHPLATRVFDFVAEEIERLSLPCFETVILQRTIYREMFLNGQAPHQADPTGKAAREFASVKFEIAARIAAAEMREVA